MRARDHSQPRNVSEALRDFGGHCQPSQLCADSSGKRPLVQHFFEREHGQRHFLVMKCGISQRRCLSSRNVSEGSISTKLGCPRHVRFSPDSDRTADIAGGPGSCRFCCKSLFVVSNENSRATGAFCARRCEGPYRLIQNLSRTSVVALKSTQQQRGLKINFREIFRVVRFSTFATKSAQTGPTGTIFRSPVIEVDRKWPTDGQNDAIDP
jgi:hypothetical protein